VDELQAQRRYSTDDDLTRRAFAAWFRSGGTNQPSSASGLIEWQGKQYVILQSALGTLAVYRVRPGGQLKRLKRWPAQVADK
jgi:hypothetical protein